MRIKMVNTVTVRTKMLTAAAVAILTAMTVGIISASADINSVNSGTMNQLIYGNNWYASNTLNTDNNICSFYSMPTYGTVDKEGPYCLGVDKEGFLWGKQVLGRNPKMYSRMANTTDSVYLGQTSGQNLSFSVYCDQGSDGAKFYLTKFRGEYRH